MLSQRLDARLLRSKESYVQALKEMGIVTLEDLLLYFPRTYRDEQNFTQINEMRTDEVNVIQGTVKSIVATRTRTGKSMIRAVVADESGEVPVMWFNQAHLKQMFFKGSPIVLTGKLSFNKGRIMMMSPKYERPSDVLLHTGRLVPVYPEREPIQSSWLRKKIYPLLAYAQYLVDPMPKWILEEKGLMSFSKAVKEVHFPKNDENLKAARRRLAFDELFKLQLAALKKKKIWQEGFNAGRQHRSLSLEPFLDQLPFELTGAQKRVLEHIQSDMGRDFPMLRLVQGDVGAGKTVVAAAALYLNFLEKNQGAFMAPTEILARQHYKSLVKLLQPFGLNVQLLTGSSSAGDRDKVLTQVATGTCDLLVGTHALIQDSVQFPKLGLAVVDEQHRFGVKQREKLLEHGRPHLLSLSATPIPRTLALTLYGDQDVSVLDELPPGRQEIITRLVPEAKRQDAYLWISDQVKKGRQVFIICPLVEESEAIQVKSAVEEYERLQKEVFPDHRIGLLHGRMKAQEKDETMKSFSAGDLDILVSTSVVEVGIDVPNASIMMIEGADRFGLAQLHQFRGRVGRGQHQSYCFLLTDSSSGDARQRLNHMVKHSSGFDLAELDLAMRGPGEVYGVKQSGLPDLKVASLNDLALIQEVREVAARFIDAN